MNRQTIGIVGGLCPLATADIYLKAMKQVKAAGGDADYPDIIISAAVEQQCRGTEFDSTPDYKYDMTHRMLYIYQVVKDLKKQGANSILVPGFLSYSFMDTIKANLNVPLVDIVEVLTEAISDRWNSVKKVGMLTRTSSIDNKIFEKSFSAKNIEPVYPDDAYQQKIMEAVYGKEGIKRGTLNGRPCELISEVCSHLFEKGAEVVVSAITELPLLEGSCYPAEKYIDCNEAIGNSLVSPAKPVIANSDKQKIVGILGGLGPAATVDIFDKIISHTPASCDQEHIRIIIENNPQIPDRTANLQNRGEDPSLAMLATAQKLKESGADVIIIPCNTAHAFWEKVKEHIDIPVLSMIEETALFIKKNYPDCKHVGLLATSGTVGTGLYAEALQRHSLTAVNPDAGSQENLVMEAIYGQGGIKAGNTTGLPYEQLKTAAEELIEKGAQAIILGCTEIPLVLKNGQLPVPLIDASEVLAKAAVNYAVA
jgi:aspartate racemase